MKKLISLFISLIVLSLSLLNVYAKTPTPPQHYAQRYFKQLYAKIDTVENLSFANDSSYLTSDFNTNIDYILVEYNSENAVQEHYFNRFGKNNEYYEYSETTNLLFESGLTVFAGMSYSDSENHDDDFYSLEEIASTNPEIIDMIIEMQITQRVGYIGDADGDGEVSVVDATEIQRHIAKLGVISNEKVVDVDNNGTTDVFDATAVQRNLVNVAQ